MKNRDDLENASVSFSVGMVMKHKRYSYTCVIHGWDPVCKQSQVRKTTLRKGALFRIMSSSYQTIL